MCYYCGQHLRIKDAVLVCVNVLCLLFGVAQNKKQIDVVIKQEDI
jgi:hypothetical protein